MRERIATPNPYEQEELQEIRDLTKDLISLEEWERHRELGRDQTVEALLADLHAERDIGHAKSSLPLAGGVRGGL